MPDDLAGLKQKFTPQPGKILERHPQVCSARFTPDGRFLIAGGFDGLISRWDATQESFPELPAVTGHEGWVTEVCFEPTGTVAISADSWGRLRCWSLAEPASPPRWEHPAAHTSAIQSLAVNSDGTMIASAGNDRLVRCWSVADGHKLHEFNKHTAPVLRVATQPGGQLLASGDLHGQVHLWDLSHGAWVLTCDAGSLFKLDRLQDTGGVRALTFDPTGAQLVVGGTKVANGGNVQGVPTLLVFETATGKLLQTLELGVSGDVYVSDLAFHPAGFLIIAISGNPGVGKLMFRRLDDAEPIALLTNIPNCHSLSLHPQRKALAVVGTNSGSNGNGRQLDKNGEYPDNFSPIHILTLPAAE